ncbi:hypothetical protein CH261_15535 [Rhodococcus sp. 05-2254-3]|nr:hypothetical protein CH261_15535 [Rhodococcus sp. 05-2254-3]
MRFLVRTCHPPLPYSGHSADSTPGLLGHSADSTPGLLGHSAGSTPGYSGRSAGSGVVDTKRHP